MSLFSDFDAILVIRETLVALSCLRGEVLKRQFGILLALVLVHTLVVVQYIHCTEFNLKSILDICGQN